MDTNASAYSDDPGGLTPAEAARLALRIAQDRYQPILEIFTKIHAEYVLDCRRVWSKYNSNLSDSPPALPHPSKMPGFDEGTVQPSFAQIFQRAVLDVERMQDTNRMQAMGEAGSCHSEE